LGGNVSDEFAAPARRGHQRELRRTGHERLWRRERNIDPESIVLAPRQRLHSGPSSKALQRLCFGVGSGCRSALYRFEKIDCGRVKLWSRFTP
jgi:hypothetical protein